MIATSQQKYIWQSKTMHVWFKQYCFKQLSSKILASKHVHMSFYNLQTSGTTTRILNFPQTLQLYLTTLHSVAHGRVSTIFSSSPPKVSVVLTFNFTAPSEPANGTFCPSATRWGHDLHQQLAQSKLNIKLTRSCIFSTCCFFIFWNVTGCSDNGCYWWSGKKGWCRLRKCFLHFSKYADEIVHSNHITIFMVTHNPFWWVCNGQTIWQN